MLRWLALTLGLVLSLVAARPFTSPSQAGLWAGLMALYVLAQVVAPPTFPLAAAIFLTLAASPWAGRGAWLVAVLAGLGLRLARKRPLTEAIPELWAGAAAGLMPLDPSLLPWASATVFLASWSLEARGERTLASAGMLVILGAAACLAPPLPAVTISLASLLLAVPVQAHLQTQLSSELEHQQQELAGLRASQLAALDLRQAELDLQQQEISLQIRCLKVVSDLFSESNRVQNAAHLRNSLLNSVRNLIPCAWVGLFHADGAMLTGVGDPEFKLNRAPEVQADRARPVISEHKGVYQLAAQERERLVLRSRDPFGPAQADLLQRFMPHLPVCLDSIRFQDNQARALGDEQVRRQELSRLASRLTATLDLLARLVGCRSLEELAHTAQTSLPELIPKYQADIQWRGQTFKQGLALNRASELNWPLTSGLETCGSLRLSTSAGSPLSDLDRELLRLFASQFSCLMEAAELQDNLRQTLEQLRQSQVQLVETSKLAAVGQLAAGVAHELNTPLGAITVGCELVQTFLDRDVRKAGERLEGIMGAAKRMQDIIAKLLLYSSYTGASRRPVDLAEVAADALTLINHKGVNIRLLPSQVPPVWANPAEVQQIIRNLLLNAIDADAHDIELRLEAGQGSVNLQIEDDGCGMSPEVSPHLRTLFLHQKRGQGVRPRAIFLTAVSAAARGQPDPSFPERPRLCFHLEPARAGGR
ncbi:hypothetical protein JST97_04255 [bacterium]|nr:hypothetical protein [bacterium]